MRPYWRFTEYEEGHYFIESRTVLLRGVGGYVSLKDKKTVNTQTPFLWRFEEIAENSRVYQLKPVHPDFASEALASVHDDGFKDWTQAQAGLVPDNREDDKQQWIFIEAPVTPYGCTEPIPGRNYYVFNVGRERWLDLAESKTNDGNFVLAWYKNSMPTANQIWNFTELSGSCTLQNLAALKEKGVVGGNEGGLGGHLHVDKNDKTVIGAGPFAWELEAVGGALYKIHPKSRPETSLTCITDKVNSIPDGAAKLEHTKATDDTQLWAFIPAIELV
ncbi:hypothetical protein SCHPADRAFT_319516 [Schizopora paradoxa]|uniref:Ricin B lectin domain-containing protein n=1 Tax=Schizopora paradoxa TaxID=27342 RepID=A0A0H2RQT4_9AGAM|nr:hypothetical protein SCHPADRAFT_319516 [Schizopora paradoxa]